MAGITGPVVYTGNNVDIYVNGSLFGYVETLTVTRSVNRRPVYVVGSPLFIDAPTTQATVTVQATNLVPIGGTAAPHNALTTGNNVPPGSLVAEVYSNSYDIAVFPHTSNTTVQTSQPASGALYQITGAYFNQDSVQVPNTDILAYNLSWTAQDTQVWTA